MDRTEATARQRERECELRALGVRTLSLFGSVARGEESASSDIDVAVSFEPSAKVGLIRWAGIAGHLENWLADKVDMVSEPARGPHFQAEIERDRVLVF